MKSKPFVRLAASFGLSLTYAFLGLLLFLICFNPYIKPVKSVFSVMSGNTSSLKYDSIFIPKYDGDDSSQPTEISISEIVVPKYGQQFGELSIESVNLTQALYMGDSLDILRLGVGLSTSTQFPGFGSKSLLCGHNTSPYLKALEDVEKGDIITVRTSYGNYKYEIYDIRIADASDESAYRFETETETLIIYTCYPFSLGFDSSRYFVYAKKISGPNVIR